MIEALKYINPIWYFNVRHRKELNFYFLDYRKLSDTDKHLIDWDSNYNKLSLFDASFQALRKGIMIGNPEMGLTDTHFENIPISDEYNFIRKYFHLGWSLYFLFFRIIQFNNPFKEIYSFFKSLKIKKKYLYTKVAQHNLNDLNSLSEYKISIILPTLNRYEHLSKVLNNLSHQSLSPFEIIIVDQSKNKREDLYKSFQHLPLKIIYQQTKGQWFARNEAIKNAKGDFLLFIDDDSIVNEDWTAQHVKCLLHFNADISAGITLNENSNPSYEKKNYHWAEEFDSGNALVRRKVFEKLGLFDNSFNGIRMGDTEFGLRACLNGFKSVSNPHAIRIHTQTSSGGMRDWKSFNSFKPMNFGGSRPNIGALYLFKRYYQQKYLAAFLLARIYLSYIPTGVNKWRIGNLAGMLLFIVFSPYWILSLFLNLNKIKKYTPDIPFLD